MESSGGNHQQPGAQNEPFFDLLQQSAPISVPTPGFAYTAYKGPKKMENSPEFNFGGDDVLPSFDFQPIRAAAASSSSNAGGGPSSSEAKVEESRGRQGSPPSSCTSYEPMVRRSREPPPTYETPLSRSQEHAKESFDSATAAAVERTMKKYADNLLRVLEGMTGRLSQLESTTQRLEHLFEEIKNAVADTHGEADGKLRSLENHILEVHRGVQVLRDRQEIFEAQSELAKLQSTTKGESKPLQSVPSAPLPPPPALEPSSQLVRVTSGKALMEAPQQQVSDTPSVSYYQPQLQLQQMPALPAPIPQQPHASPQQPQPVQQQHQLPVQQQHQLPVQQQHPHHQQQHVQQQLQQPVQLQQPGLVQSEVSQQTLQQQQPPPPPPQQQLSLPSQLPPHPPHPSHPPHPPAAYGPQQQQPQPPYTQQPAPQPQPPYAQQQQTAPQSQPPYNQQQQPTPQPPPVPNYIPPPEAPPYSQHPQGPHPGSHHAPLPPSSYPSELPSYHPSYGPPRPGLPPLQQQPSQMPPSQQPQQPLNVGMYDSSMGRSGSGQLSLPAPPYLPQGHPASGPSHYEAQGLNPGSGYPGSSYRVAQPVPSAPSGGSGGYPRLPVAQPLPHALPTSGGGAGAPSSGNPPLSTNRVPIDEVIDKVTAMGFSKDQVRAVVRRLTENGQSVDLNIVLDKLMNGDSTQPPPKSWFGR